jgi:serine/threonine protein kinase
MLCMVLCSRCAVPCDDGHHFCFACGGELAAPTDAEDPLIGRTLPGGYRVTHLVGVGGMGRVYCAEQVALGRTVAVKVVHPSLADEEQTAARFLNEARAASRLSHPNSVAIFDFGRTDDGRPYIVMEYLRGRDLSRVASDEGPLPLPRLVDVLKQTLAALEEAHALGIVHRDLKPDNIVLEPLRSGLDFVKVVDFGLAKILQSEANARGPAGGPLHGGALTRPGLVCGTPEYMSPEQSRGDALDGRSDLYSVGIVLFELLAGRVPFVADTATKTLILHLTEAPPDPRDVAPERTIPASFAQLAAQALAKSADERFQSAREFADALDRALLESEGRPSSEPAPSTAVRCRACGAASPMGQKFCGDCGASIASKPPPMSSRRPAPIPREDAFAATLWPSDATSIAPALPLLARDDAMAWLDSRYHEAGAVLAVARIVGDDGMGKTRLVREFLARCALRGDFVVLVTPDPSRARIGDAALRTAIRALAGLPEGPVDPALWDAAYPDARMGMSLIFGADGDPPSGPGRRRALSEALRWALEAAAERARSGPVVLAVDDIDLIDGTSKNAFEDVLAEPPLVSALVVMTHSPGAASMLEAFPAETWTLGPLPYDAFGARLSQRVAARGVALAPLHVEQLIAWARESTDAPPERLIDVIARRVERLLPDARHVLQALAVWGDEASPDALWRVLPTGIDVGAALDALDRARIVAIDERGIRIAHPLVRRVVFSSVPAGRKQELFAKAASLRPDAPLEVRAKQAMHGGSSFEALSLLDVLSARRAAHGDLAGSVRSLRHALDVARRELHRGEIDDPVGAVLIFSRKLAEALADQEHFADAEGVLREALGTAPPTSPHRAHLLGVLARVADARSQPEDARRYLEEAMRVARQSDARSLLPILERLDKRIAVA